MHGCGAEYCHSLLSMLHWHGTYGTKIAQWRCSLCVHAVSEFLSFFMYDGSLFWHRQCCFDCCLFKWTESWWYFIIGYRKQAKRLVEKCDVYLWVQCTRYGRSWGIFREIQVWLGCVLVIFFCLKPEIFRAENYDFVKDFCILTYLKWTMNVKC